MTNTATPARPARRRRLPAWTDDLIVDRIRAYAVEHGRAPLRAEWEFATPDNPTRRSVEKRFGTWEAAIRAAGLEPVSGRVSVKAAIDARFAELDARIEALEEAAAAATDPEGRARVRRDAAALADAIRGGDQAS